MAWSWRASERERMVHEISHQWATASESGGSRSTTRPRRQEMDAGGAPLSGSRAYTR